MDYIREINAFYDHDLANRLSQSAGCLYLAILNMANRLFWKEGFMVSDAMLMARSGIKDRRTFKRVISELTRHNLIVVQDDRNGNAYTVCGLSYRPARDAATDVTRNAAKDAKSPVDDARNAALNAALNPKLGEKTAKNAAMNAANHAGSTESEARMDGTSLPAQTKQNKQNQTEKQSANADENPEAGETAEANSSQLIARLVQAYRQIPGISETGSDYSFIGSLYNEYGCQRVLHAINEMTLAAAAGHIQKPLPYLRAILKRAGPDSGPGPPNQLNKSGEEDPVERYERERYRG